MDFGLAERNEFYNGLQADLLRLHNFLLKKAGAQTEKKVEEGEVLQAEMRWFSPALQHLQEYFQLSFFECQVLLFCVGIEISRHFSALFERILGEQELNYFTPELLVKLLGEEDWCAFSPQAPLRYWRLLEYQNSSSLRLNKLAVSERIMDFFLGIEGFDIPLRAILHPLQAEESLASSHEQLAQQILHYWRNFAEKDSKSCSIHLTGIDSSSIRQVAFQACQLYGLPLYRLETKAIPNNSHEFAGLLLLLRREVILSRCVYLVEYERQTEEDSFYLSALNRLIECLQSHCILAARESPSWLNQPVIEIKVQRPTSQEQLMMWQQQLPSPLADDLYSLEQLVSHFDLNAVQVAQIVARCHIEWNSTHTDQKQKVLWQYCRNQTRQTIEGLVRVIEPKAGWEDLILPEMHVELLRNLMFQVLHRYQVYYRWEFAKKYTRGLGICALFAGPSGTGKTLAAEVLAKELSLDLYHIDLSQVMNKYVGETEKQLKKVFDKAEASGALLLFDEADALFGKRGEVKDSHDRYANLEISYLLQLMESYRGLSILTTNSRETLDEAFIRRIRFIINFPFPDFEQRLQMWQKAFPDAVAHENLDFSKLARLNLAGGPIRNIAINAAFIAAEMKQPLTMHHLLRAAHMEYLKLNRPLLKKEVENWV